MFLPLPGVFRHRAARKPLAVQQAIFCALVFVAVMTAGTSAAAQSTSAPAVTVAKPLSKEITEWDEYTGRFVAKQRVEVRSRVSGFLDSVHFNEGEMVTAGQLLFVIDPRPFEAEVARERAKLEQVRTTLRVAQLEYERGERLESSNAMSRETMEERRAARDAAQAEVNAASASLRAAELNLGFTKIQAPMSGRVSDIRVDVGNLVSGGSAQSTLLTTIVSLDPIELEFEGSETDILYYMRLDQTGARPSSRAAPNPVQARLIDEDDWEHNGVMTFVDNELDPDTATIRGRATFKNPQHLLLPGMFARLRLFGEGKHEALLIPDAAVVTDQALKLVLTLDSDNIVQARAVKLGPLIDGLRVVRDGLNADDRIVIKGLLRARPGNPVNPSEETLVDTAADNN